MTGEGAVEQKMASLFYKISGENFKQFDYKKLLLL